MACRERDKCPGVMGASGMEELMGGQGEWRIRAGNDMLPDVDARMCTLKASKWSTDPAAPNANLTKMIPQAQDDEPRMKEMIVANDENAQPMHMPTPDPALKRLERLVGTWSIKGRTLGSQEENISGRVVIEWLPGGFFLQQRGEMEFKGFRVESLELVGYDPSTQAFSSYVYSNMGEEPQRYQWDVQGDVVTHWTEGSKYTGTFSEDSTILSGGWRPDDGKEGPDNAAYDAVMIRVVGE